VADLAKHAEHCGEAVPIVVRLNMPTSLFLTLQKGSRKLGDSVASKATQGLPCLRLLAWCESAAGIGQVKAVPSLKPSFRGCDKDFPRANLAPLSGI
jgi:hypothetical protein